MQLTPTSLVSETNSNVKKCKKSLVKILVLMVFVCLVFGIVGVIAFIIFRNQNQTTQTTNSTSHQTADALSVARSPFANVKVEQVAVTPNVPAYDLGSDNANIVNLKRFEFSGEVKTKLLKDKFVVVQKDEISSDRSSEEFFKTYETNRYNEVPSFITTDAVLHNYHLVFDDTLKTLETTVFSDKVAATVQKMFDISQEQYGYFMGSDNIDLGNAAARNEAYFAVALKLLGKDVVVPDYIKDVVNQ